jgi:hypothetical protein
MSKLKFFGIITIIVSLALPHIVFAETRSHSGGFRYSMNEVAPDRHRIIRENGKRVERFELRHGDCNWYPNKGRDCKTHRERVEVSGKTYDKVGQTVCYRFDLKLPKDYREMSPKQTLGQWHDRKYGDAFSNRYRQGNFILSRQYGGGTVDTKRIPFRKGKWNSLQYRFNIQNNKTGSIEVWLDGKKVYNAQKISVLPKGLKSWYFKYGIYRSHLHRFKGKTRPTQIAFYRNIKRFAGKSCQNL